MKSIRSILLVSLLCVAGCGTVSACIGPRYYPKAYLMFRLRPFGDDPTITGERWNRRLKNVNDYNCELWQQQTSLSIPLDSIASVVLRYSVEQMQALRSRAAAGGKALADTNPFADWLVRHRDTDAIDLLILAKECEAIRTAMQDPWYYPDSSDELHGSLDSIYRAAMAPRKTRFEDRYQLQAMRALFSMGRYEECVTFWNNIKVSMPQTIIRHMTGRYAAGALFRMRETDRAVALYAECDDIEHVAWCLSDRYPKNDVAARMECIYDYYPQAAELTRQLQKTITAWESTLEYRDALEPKAQAQCERLRTLALRAAAERKVAEPAAWQYAAAYMSVLLNDPYTAKQQNQQAAQMKGSALVKESIRFLDIYLDAVTTPAYNSVYQQRLQSQLRWMEQRIQTALKNGVNPSDLFWNTRINQTFLYPNDMLRKTLLGVVVPRSLEQGRPVLALLAANYADNRIYELMGLRKKRGVEWFGADRQAALSEDAYSVEERTDNYYDFSNAYFQLMDTISTKTLVEYGAVMNGGRTASSLERFFRSRGYRDADYLNDIIGTRFLRAFDYPQAARYLAKVSPAYQGRLNTAPYMQYDPFADAWRCRQQPVDSRWNYKLSFARQMCSWQKQMHSSDAKRRAEATIRYAMGLYNSHHACWALTRYSDGMVYSDTFDATEMQQQALQRSTEIFQKLLSSTRDSEVQAHCHLALATLGDRPLFGTQTDGETFVVHLQASAPQADHLKALQSVRGNSSVEREFAGHCDYYRLYIEQESSSGGETE